MNLATLDSYLYHLSYSFAPNKMSSLLLQIFEGFNLNSLNKKLGTPDPEHSQHCSCDETLGFILADSSTALSVLVETPRCRKLKQLAHHTHSQA